MRVSLNCIFLIQSIKLGRSYTDWKIAHIGRLPWTTAQLGSWITPRIRTGRKRLWSRADLQLLHSSAEYEEARAGGNIQHGRLNCLLFRTKVPRYIRNPPAVQAGADPDAVDGAEITEEGQAASGLQSLSQLQQRCQHVNLSRECTFGRDCLSRSLLAPLSWTRPPVGRAEK